MTRRGGRRIKRKRVARRRRVRGILGTVLFRRRGNRGRRAVSALILRQGEIM